MPEKRPASHTRSPVAKRKRTAKATSTAHNTADPKATASKTASSRTTSVLDNGAAGSPLPSGPPRTDRSTPGSVARSVKANPPAPKTPEESSKRPKASDKMPEPKSSEGNDAEEPKKQQELEICPMCGEEYDSEDEDDDICEFHPGKLVIDRKVPCWKSDWRVDPYSEEYVEESFESHELYPDMLMWDCCGCSEGAPGCETQSGHGEY
ncbi:uncharacterized protein B0T23DRAFT_403210 [Neurospora hispaniola]|uniref:Uncharacterized protein n=1 Tax=Neurospora hispaniola TaxID=588809 RepID=A0AAJ0MRY9_9PEZI|nr:hypothetical protein B0T23DRAFT_403210 [Neurospora hispaniola]